MVNASIVIHSLLLPVHGTMLLPHATVAEVIPYGTAEAASHVPAWLIGMLPWRGTRIPLIFFEGVCGEPMPDSTTKQRKIAVLKTLGADPSMPFIAVVTQGIPRAIKIDANALIDEGRESVQPFILKHVQVKGQPAYIPNLDSLENTIKLALVTIN